MKRIIIFATANTEYIKSIMKSINYAEEELYMCFSSNKQTIRFYGYLTRYRSAYAIVTASAF